MNALALRLLRDGVVSIPIQEISTAAQRDAALRALDLEMLNFPEFNERYVHDGGAMFAAGVSALGTASSFHNLFVRRLRQQLQTHARELFQELVSLPMFEAMHQKSRDFKLEQLIDRLLVRPGRARATAEAWHRDTSPGAEPEDVIFGGWVNFSQHRQTLSCQLCSHADGGLALDGVGLKPIKDAALNARLRASKSSVEVLPGEMLVFYDSIVYEVVAAAQKNVTSKLLTGWRLTHRDSPLMGTDRLEEVLATGAIVPLKSDQLPPMFSKQPRRLNWWSELEAWSVAAIREALLEEVRDKETRAWKTLVPKFMPSLEEMDEPFKLYTVAEKRIYYPSLLFLSD